MEKKELKYKEKRKGMGLSREKAAELLAMSDDKLERIENGKQVPYPEDVLGMAKKYRAPELCNYYCSNQCAIGKKYVQEIPGSELPSVVLNLLDSLYQVEDMDKLLVRITADEKIAEEEVPDMAMVQYHFDQLAVMIDALRIHVERKIGAGEIRQEAYEEAYRTAALMEMEE